MFIIKQLLLSTDNYKELDIIEFSNNIINNFTIKNLNKKCIEYNIYLHKDVDEVNIIKLKKIIDELVKIYEDILYEYYEEGSVIFNNIIILNTIKNILCNIVDENGKIINKIEKLCVEFKEKQNEINIQKITENIIKMKTQLVENCNKVNTNNKKNKNEIDDLTIKHKILHDILLC
jgi:hypothetical protein